MNLTDHPDGQYKFFSAGINVDKSFVAISRQTYNFLDWLGDIGGLSDGFYLIIKMSISSYLSFSKAGYLMAQLFRQVLPR